MPKADPEQPVAGDLWALSWNAEEVGHAVISAVHESFVLAWPAEINEDNSFFPGILVEMEHQDAPVTVWPTRETGIGNHLLDHRIGQAIHPSQIAPVSTALEEGKETAFPFAARHREDLNQESYDNRMLEHWQELCFLTVESTASEFFDRDEASKIGLKAKEVAEALGLSHTELSPIWKGQVPLSDQAIERLRIAFGETANSLLTTDPLGHVLDVISSPDYKQEIKDRSRMLGMDEGDFRRRTRAEFALAARDDGDAIEPQKIRDAILRVGK
ncbi:hypothetical protein G6030_02930 [Dietzia sp. E1]|uniref:hypothetical protein n=1 Tax=Dietzia sp. E1 TaxID=328361 RepID=UPI0015F7EB28|nr:hypothetical protein [Dietzia sp. E1]MBB1020256.1 hypothetical protein [Dietzia sp. E1]